MRLFFLGGALSALILFAPASLASFDPGECLVSKPKIDSYDSYDAFIVQILRYKKLQRACENLPKALTTPEPENIVNRAVNVEFLEIDRKTGLEDMNTAVRRAKSYTHLPSNLPLKYNRTTPESIPFSKIKNTAMRQELIEKGFGEFGTSEPIPYDEMSNISLEINKNSIPFHSETSTLQQSNSFIHPSNAQVTSVSQDQNTITDPFGNSIKMRADGGTDTLIINSIQLNN